MRRRKARDVRNVAIRLVVDARLHAVAGNVGEYQVSKAEICQWATRSSAETPAPSRHPFTFTIPSRRDVRDKQSPVTNSPPLSGERRSRTTAVPSAMREAPPSATPSIRSRERAHAAAHRSKAPSMEQYFSTAFLFLPQVAFGPFFESGGKDRQRAPSAHPGRETNRPLLRTGLRIHLRVLAVAPLFSEPNDFASR